MICNKKPIFFPTDPEIDNLLYDQVDVIQNVCDVLNIKCWLIGGSLLGVARHNKKIPWDDDCDFGIPLDDIKLLYDTLVKIAPKNGMRVEYTNHGLKLRSTAKPNVGTDIFPYLLQDNNKGERWVLASDRSRAFWPNDYFLPEEISEIEKGKFGMTRLGKTRMINVPKNYLRYLKTLYGNDCMDVAKKDFNHLANVKHEDAGIAVPLNEALREI